MKVLSINEVYYPSTGWRHCKTGGNAKMNSWVLYYKGMGVTEMNVTVEYDGGKIVTDEFKVEDLLSYILA